MNALTYITLMDLNRDDSYHYKPKKRWRINTENPAQLFLQILSDLSPRLYNYLVDSYTDMTQEDWIVEVASCFIGFIPKPAETIGIDDPRIDDILYLQECASFYPPARAFGAHPEHPMWIEYNMEWYDFFDAMTLFGTKGSSDIQNMAAIDIAEDQLENFQDMRSASYVLGCYLIDNGHPSFENVGWAILYMNSITGNSLTDYSQIYIDECGCNDQIGTWERQRYDEYYHMQAQAFEIIDKVIEGLRVLANNFEVYHSVDCNLQTLHRAIGDKIDNREQYYSLISITNKFPDAFTASQSYAFDLQLWYRES